MFEFIPFYAVLLKTDIRAQKTRLKITQFEKVRFIKVNELKLTQVQLF